MVMSEADAVRQDIRPLRIGLLNLMPNKVRTETQFARLLGSTPLQVELTLVKMTNHVARNTPSEHIISFYRDWEDIRAERFDGFIVTGAPVETMPFEEVTYWDELRRVFDWTQTHVHSTFNICWGAQAAVHHFHGMPKYQLSEKAFGVYRHRNLAPASPYLRGFSDDFSIPVSRWTEVRREDIPPASGLEHLDGIRRGGALPAATIRAPLAAYVQPHRIRFEFARATSISATSRRISRSRCRATTSRRTIRAASRRTAGAATRICCSATGSTSSTRRRRSTWRRSEAPEFAKSSPMRA